MEGIEAGMECVADMEIEHKGEGVYFCSTCGGTKDVKQSAFLSFYVECWDEFHLTTNST
jgi:hypothetical protein